VVHGSQNGYDAPMKDESIRLFVYGTLKRGHIRHELLHLASYLGQGTTVQPYRLLDCGGYPGLVEGSEEHAYRVVGEVYEIPASELSGLDAYEGVPQNEYQRREVEVELDDDKDPGPKLKAQAYFYLNELSILDDIGPVWTASNEGPMA